MTEQKAQTQKLVLYVSTPLNNEFETKMPSISQKRISKNIKKLLLQLF